jgi:hypothetical protein
MREYLSSVPEHQVVVELLRHRPELREVYFLGARQAEIALESA